MPVSTIFLQSFITPACYKEQMVPGLY